MTELTYGGLTAAELLALHERATPGPWSEFCESGEWWIAQQDELGGPDKTIVDATPTDTGDMLLIPAARNALPELLAELTRLQAWRETVINLYPDGEDVK